MVAERGGYNEALASVRSTGFSLDCRFPLPNIDADEPFQAVSFFFSLLLLRKKRPNVMTMAKKIRPPITVPAIAPMGVLESLDEVLDGAAVEVGCAVCDAESSLMQLVSSVLLTVRRSELPPVAPLESYIMKMMEVS